MKPRHLRFSHSGDDRKLGQSVPSSFALPLRTYDFTIRQWRSVMTSVKNRVLVALAVVLFGSGTTTLCSGENIQPGKVYKSPNHIFTIVAPKPTGFDVHAWESGLRVHEGQP